MSLTAEQRKSLELLQEELTQRHSELLVESVRMSDQMEDIAYRCFITEELDYEPAREEYRTLTVGQAQVRAHREEIDDKLATIARQLSKGGQND